MSHQASSISAVKRRDLLRLGNILFSEVGNGTRTNTIKQTNIGRQRLPRKRPPLNNLPRFCPTCGRLINGDGWLRSDRRRLLLGDAADESVTEYERTRPVVKPSVEGHFMTPVLQALVTGFFFALIATFIVIYSELSPFYILAVFAGTSLLAWLSLMRFFNSLLVAKESVRREPSQAADVPAKEAVSIKIEAGNTTYYEEWPISLANLRLVARMVNNGISFTHRDMTGRGKPLSRNEMDLLVGRLIERDMAAWKDDDNHQLGIDLLPAGTSLFEQLNSRASQR